MATSCDFYSWHVKVHDVAEPELNREWIADTPEEVPYGVALRDILLDWDFYKITLIVGTTKIVITREEEDD